MAASTFPNTYQLLLQLETVDLQACDVVKTKLNNWTQLTFGPNLSQIHSILLAVSVLTTFGLRYSCESAFSTINAIKSEHRSVFTDRPDLQNAMLIALTGYSPNYTSIMKSGKQFYTSHCVLTVL